MPASAATPERSLPQSLAPTIALYSGFFLTGLLTALLGPLLPQMRLHYGVSEAQAGSLFIAQFVGSSIGCLFSQRRIRLSIVLGLALICGGVAALPFTSWMFAPLAVFTFGVGLGLVIPATNMFVAKTHPESCAAALNILNLIWGAGAATSPIIVAVLYSRLGFAGTLVVIATLTGAICILFLAIRMGSDQTLEMRNVRSTWRHSQGFAIFCFMLFLYIGVETSIGGWTATYVTQIAGMSAWTTWSVVAFWISLLTGRAFASLALRVMAERTLSRISLVLGTLAIAGLMVSRTGAVATICAAVIGWGLAPIFASIFSMLSRFAEGNRVAVPGWLFSCAGIGGAALPWAVGAVATRSGSLTYGFLVPALGLVALMLIERRLGRSGSGS